MALSAPHRQTLDPAFIPSSIPPGRGLFITPMRYFHRTHLEPGAVVDAADGFFGARLTRGESTRRSRSYSGTIGRITIQVSAEGGHYTLVTVETDQVGESEADKLAKRFLATVHQRTEPTHVLRGAY
jgi:hypothetical protein